MLRLCLVAIAASCATHVIAQSPSADAGQELFEKKIRPALIRYCYECHAEDSDDVGGNLLLDTRAGMLAGGETGPAITPGKPAESLLIAAIEYRDLEMPPDEKMPDEVIAAFRRWIALGAPDPRQRKSDADAKVEVPSPNSDDASELWSLKPIAHPTPPEVADDWPRSDADRFILAKLRDQDVEPNLDAKPATLIRRVYFDLIGLPPTPAEVGEFTGDPSEERLAQIVDRLLSSPQFGERWARHWLDVARYGESAGSSRDVLIPYAWRYRDYVIEAFNNDLPFNQFITEQIAGDLLPAETDSQKRQQIIATGFLAIGSKSLNGGNLTYDIIDDQIDVISKSVLGLTVSCARCHDHKFDPIPTSDYYSLAGIFLSTETRYGGGTKRPKNAQEKSDVYLALRDTVDEETAQAYQEAERKFDQLSKQVAASQKRVKTLSGKVPKEFRNSNDRADLEELDNETAKLVRQYQTARRLLGERQAELASVREQLGPEPDYAVGVREAKKVTDANVLIRGEKNQQGDVVPRGFLSAVDGIDDVPKIGPKYSGRKQLAEWLTDPANPLTARVAVNRVWQHLMGSGIVPTVDNFGVSGSPPSHPQLLDHLAYRFVHRHGWSIKALIRELVLSRTYQMSSDMNQAGYAADPDNRLRWRMPRRRLDAEQLRDAMLAVSDLLESDRYQGSLVLEIGEGEVGRNLNTSVLEEPMNHRSIYLPIIRGIIPEQLRIFDFPEPSNVQGMRDSNTTPTQSLFLMNSDFAIRVGKHFADSLLKDSRFTSDRERIEESYLRCFGIPPNEQEVEQATEFLTSMQSGRSRRGKLSDPRHRAWTAYCQTLMASARFRFID